MRPERLKGLLVDRLLDHLATGKPPRIPAGGELAWRWFVDLNATRGQGFSGPAPITWAEIEAYRRATGWPMEGRHHEMILALDSAYLGHAGIGQSATGGRAGSRGSAITAAAFDAMMG